MNQHVLLDMQIKYTTDTSDNDINVEI